MEKVQNREHIAELSAPSRATKNGKTPSSGTVTRVLQITSYPPPRAGWGMRVYFLKKAMEAEGDVCEVLNIGKSRFLTGRDFIPVFSGWDYVKKVFRYRLNGYKIHMHLNGDSPKGFILTLLAEWISLLTFHRPILTFHAGPVQIYFPREKAPWLTPMYKFIFGVARAIICNNQAVKEKIMSYGISGEKIHPIQAFSRQYLEFEEQRLAPELERLFQNHHPVIASYLFFRPVFRVRDLLEGFARFRSRYPQARLVIMGDARPEDQQLAEYAGEMMDLLDELGLRDAVYFTGDLDHDCFLTVLKRATVYLRTHIKDGVCSSVLEALSLGTPVVAVDNGIRPPGVLTYADGDVDQLVGQLEKAVSGGEEIRRTLPRPEIPDTVAQEVALLRQM